MGNLSITDSHVTEIVLLCVPYVFEARPGTPMITADKDVYGLAKGNTVRMNCSSTGGYPPPTITWYKNNVTTAGGNVSL